MRAIEDIGRAGSEGKEGLISGKVVKVSVPFGSMAVCERGGMKLSLSYLCRKT